MNNFNKPLRISSNILEQDVDGEVLIYDLEKDKALYLNRTVAEVYRLCDGRYSIADISDKLSIKLKELVSEEFVLVALDELDRNGLLEGRMPVRQTYFEGVSRREMIRRAGLTTMAALPMITALTAPKAAQAQSTAVCTVGADCTSVANCSGCTAGCVGPLVCKDSDGNVLADPTNCIVGLGGVCTDTIVPGTCFGTCQNSRRR